MSRDPRWDAYAESVRRMFLILHRRQVEHGKPANGPSREGVLAWCNFIVQTIEGKYVGLHRRWMPFPLRPVWFMRSRSSDFSFMEEARVDFMPRPEIEITFYLQDWVSSTNERVYLAREDGGVPTPYRPRASGETAGTAGR